jgi:hypothetical protein
MVNAQVEHVCIFDPSTEDFDEPGGMGPMEHNTGRTDQAFLDTFEPKLFNVQFWQVNNATGGFRNDEGVIEDGNVVFEQTKQDVLKSIAYLNQQYNEYKIFFKYRGVEQLDSPSNLIGLPDVDCSSTSLQNFNQHGFNVLEYCLHGQLSAHVKNTGHYNEDAINIYLVAGTVNFGGITNGTETIQNLANVGNGVMAHEIGHVFGLQHTQTNYAHRLGASNVTIANECEHVTRIATDLNFNAISNADGIPDTNAVPNFHREYCWNNNIPVNTQACTDAINAGNYSDYNIAPGDDCFYIGFGEDCEGTPYLISPEDVQNHMAYTRSVCRNQFTIGQGIRMHEDIEHFYNLTYKDAIELDFSSLYEPYAGEYYGAGPFYEGLHTPLFQPGFDYSFIPCEGPYVQPAPFGENFTAYPLQTLYTISAFEEDLSTIYHPNHTAIIIDQIDQAFGFARIEKCYDNYNRAPKGGRIVRFNDGVFNYNTTTTEKDSLGINNETLINTLDPGLYKVEKDYNGGTTTQTIIQKNND